jgi:glyoxylase-like metal-dependent hydrolase (beta-lactamase superfamily II)
MDCHSKKQWFSIERINSNLFLITEPFFYEGNRCNIWLIKGGDKDRIIDCGLGVSNLRKFLEGKHLLDPIDKPKARTCIVVCTHVHFDHSGGAHDFEHVFIHNKEASALITANSLYTLNWVKSEHFNTKPFSNFDISKYRVKETNCIGQKMENS